MLKEILQQFILIKEAMETNDNECIPLMLENLSLFDLDNEALLILYKIKQKNHKEALADIDKFINANSDKSIFEDQKLNRLKEELNAVEQELHKLQDEKSRYLLIIDEFNTQYSLKLGELIRKVLSLKRGAPYRQVVDKVKKFNQIKQIYNEKQEEYKTLKTHKEKLEIQLERTDEFDDSYDDIYDDLLKIKEKLEKNEANLQSIREKLKRLKDTIKKDPAHKEYQQSTQEYQEFKEEHEELTNGEKFDLTDEERGELKRVFRRAVKLCHPDIVSEQLKEQAQSTIQELNSAYKKQDLQSVNEILHSLENHMKFDIDSNTLNEIEFLKFKILNTQQKVKETLIDIDEIKNDETYTTIDTIDDWDEYFSQTYNMLKEEYEELKEELLKGINEV